MKITERYALDAFQNEVGDWAEATFGFGGQGERYDAILAHAQRELVELREAVVDNVYGFADNYFQVQSEIADVVLLLMHLAYKFDFSLEQALREKHAINITRQWGLPDEFGVIEHIRDKI
jgi:NTP pyrophosphatase (non-canonical NTP hydrolase)